MSSLLFSANGDQLESLEDMHLLFVAFHKKSNNILEKLEMQRGSGDKKAGECNIVKEIEEGDHEKTVISVDEEDLEIEETETLVWFAT